jgi:two-component system LytT family response regulator
MSFTLKAIVVEDEKTSREILRNYLYKYCPNVQVVGEAQNVDEALVLIRNNKLDLVFLDVEMPYGNAFDLLDRVGDIDFETVFVTAYNQYAMEALNQHAAYYLLKPISIDELIKAVDFVTKIKKKEQQFSDEVLTPIFVSANEKISIPTQNGFELIDTDKILYCQADDNYTHIYLKDDQKKLVSKTLGFFEKQLTDKGFFRIHKSYLINMNHIKSYQKGKGGMVVLYNGKSLPVASSKKASFLSFFK